MPYDMWDAVIEDMRGRQRLGLAEYGAPLRPTSQRDWLREFYHELLDAVVYAKTEMAWRDRRAKRLLTISGRDRRQLARLLGELQVFLEASITASLIPDGSECMDEDRERLIADRKLWKQAESWVKKLEGFRERASRQADRGREAR